MEIKEMNAAQNECYQMLVDFVHGEHHLPGAVKPCCPDGIMILFHRGTEFATYDGNELTRLVLMAHDRCIRVAISTRGMNLNLKLHKRHCRTGSLFQRHPAMREVLKNWENRQYTGLLSQLRPSINKALRAMFNKTVAIILVLSTLTACAHIPNYRPWLGPDYAHCGRHK